MSGNGSKHKTMDLVIASIMRMSMQEVRDRIHQAKEHVSKIDALFPGLITLNSDKRKQTQGMLREGEAEALSSVLNVVELAPQLFIQVQKDSQEQSVSLVNVEQARHWLEVAKELQVLSEFVSEFETKLSDTTSQFAFNVREQTQPAYQLAKAHESSHAVIATELTTAKNFYGAAARGRKAKQARLKRENLKKGKNAKPAGGSDDGTPETSNE